MKEHRIVDRGDGPKIEGTRITVYTIFEDLQKGRSREWIASMVGLLSRQVQAAIDYIDQHHDDVESEYERIMDRIRQGNPAKVQQQLQESRRKFRKMTAHRQHEALDHAEDHGGQ